MSRIKYSKVFLPQTVLLENILTKNEDDGENSVLLPFLELHKIDVIKLAEDIIAAIEYNDLFLFSKNLSEKELKSRNLLIKPIVKRMRSMIQYLKKLNAPNYKELGDWGIEITKRGKVIFPTDVSSQIDLFFLMKTKNDDYPKGTSPLEQYVVFHAIDFIIDAASLDEAVIWDKNFVQDKLDSENMRQDRDLIWNLTMKKVKAIGSFLKKLFYSNERMLGDWGYTVVKKRVVAKIRSSNVYWGKPLLNRKEKLGNTLKNMGNVNLNIFRGKVVSGIPFLLKVGKTFFITKGYTHVCIVSTSPSSMGKISSFTA